MEARNLWPIQAQKLLSGQIIVEAQRNAGTLSGLHTRLKARRRGTGVGWKLLAGLPRKLCQ